MKSFGLFVRAGMPRPGFYLVFHNFIYTKSDKRAAFPSFPKGLVRVLFLLGIAFLGEGLPEWLSLPDTDLGCVWF